MFQIPGVQFAVANDSNYTFSGILGLGYSYPYSISYPSILNLMVSQKLISAPIFSLGLGGDQDGFSMIVSLSALHQISLIKLPRQEQC